jgi:hypothetical protein
MRHARAGVTLGIVAVLIGLMLYAERLHVVGILVAVIGSFEFGVHVHLVRRARFMVESAT